MVFRFLDEKTLWAKPIAVAGLTGEEGVPEIDFNEGSGFWGAFKRWMGLPAREVAG